jgi:Dyp-type peroxidase family
MPVLNETERADIQGNILRAYGFRYARYSILRVVDPAGARRLLAALLAKNLILSAATWDRTKADKPTSAINVFFTHAGLAAMGLSPAKLATFPPEFIQGMAARADLLGDKGPDAPAHWAFGRDSADTHVFVTVCGLTTEAKDEMVAKLYAELAAVGPAVEVTHRLDVAAFPTHREHFGYADGIGQPSIEGSGEPHLPGAGTLTSEGWVPLKAGEFVLGYEGETGSALPVPGGDFGRNGSFMVYRQLAQHVPAFRDFLRKQAERVYHSDSPENVEKLAAKLVGRWRSGCPLSRSPDKDDPAQVKDWQLNNNFSYAGDPKGAVCPIGSHIRRMNPRDAAITGLARTHRIVRRGLPYGPQLPEGAPDDGVERGVAFMAINASIAHQFEILQRDWANDCEFAGLDKDDVDPLIGERREGVRFRVLNDEGKTRRMHLTRFVTLRGGGYFFIPSLTALHALAAGTA